MNQAVSNPKLPDARRLAAGLLRSCIDKKLTVEEAIAGSSAVTALDTRDRGFLATLLLTVFRHRGEIDAVLSSFLDRPLPRKSGPAREILELGVAQLLFLGMPAHAVIDQAVRSAKEDRNALHFAGLVNAVLRKVASAGAAALTGLDTARLNTPGWLWDRWARIYGEETARRIGLAHGERPGLDISFRESSSTGAEALGGVPLPNGQVRLTPGHAPVPELPGFHEGAWWIQDAAATLPARLLGEVAGMRVLDLCAAPGGKTLQLAAMGAQVTAIDVSEARMRRVRENLARTGLTADLHVEDMLSPEFTGAWDAVLLDAPCSATGTIRRHPELPYLKDASQIAELASLQRRMLRKAAELVKPGGTIVYCTCSLEPEEGEGQVKSFLKKNEAFDVVPADPALLPDGALQAEGWVRTLPFMMMGSEPGMDGFFAVALRRRP